jgi:hypothetical protein
MWSIWTNEMTVLIFLHWGIWAYAATIHLSILLLLIWGIWYKQWWLPFLLWSLYSLLTDLIHLLGICSYGYHSFYDLSLFLLIRIIWHMQWIWPFWLWSSILLFINWGWHLQWWQPFSAYCTEPFGLVHEKQYLRNNILDKSPSRS